MNPRLTPAWKQAILDFDDLDPKPGTTIDDAWLCEHFELPKPINASAEQWQDWNLKFLRYRDEFKRHIGEDFSIQFSDRENGVMRVLHPSEIADYTEAKARRELKVAVRRQKWRLKNTDFRDMTQEQAMNHVNTMARAEMRAKSIRDSHTAKLPSPKEVVALPKIFGTAEKPESEK